MKVNLASTIALYLIAVAIFFSGCMRGCYGHRLVEVVEHKAVVLDVENLNVDAEVGGTMRFNEGDKK